MKFDSVLMDELDRMILQLLQDDCKVSLAKIGSAVGLSAPSVVERIRKLEHGGVISGYHALINARRVGLDVTAFIGVSISHPSKINAFEREVAGLADVLECHHVTGVHSVLLKIKTRSTASLEELISRIRSIDGVERTETMVVLSTHTERVQIEIGGADDPELRRGRRQAGCRRPPTAA